MPSYKVFKSIGRKERKRIFINYLVITFLGKPKKKGFPKERKHIFSKYQLIWFVFSLSIFQSIFPIIIVICYFSSVVTLSSFACRC